VTSIGQRIRDARVAHGLTQEELARGVATKGFISLIEHDLARASLPKLRLLAERLGRPLSHFIEDAPSDLAYLRKAAELAIKAREPARSLALVKEAAALAGTANERADLCRLEGMALTDLGRRDEALAALQTAAATAPPDDPELNSSIYAELGRVHGELERFNASAEANLRALHWLDRSRHGDLDLRARVLTNLASDCYSMGQVARATTYYRRALGVAVDSESLLRMAHAHMALGVTSRAAGDVGAALEHCSRALELHRRLGHDRIANQILNNLGDVHFAAGKLAEARASQTRCLERGRELGDDLAIGAAAGELARYALADGELEHAQNFANEGLNAARRAGDHLRQAWVLALQGHIEQERGHWAVSDGCFSRAFRLLLRRQAAGRLADVCAEYSEVLGQRGDSDRALAFMRMAYARDFEGVSRELPRMGRGSGRGRQKVDRH
jgi:HTH-type transcriptional regulator, quorum sensing regulator NprR